MSRSMGLDVGTKTIGVAVSDERYTIAQPLLTLQRSGIKKDLAALAEIIHTQEVTLAVVGLPLHMNGSEGERAQASRSLGEALESHSKIEIVYWDERLTTAEAQRLLISADVRREKRKKVIDQLAASLILQGWLDSRAIATGDEE